jgi:Transposase DDE domain group 1
LLSRLYPGSQQSSPTYQPTIDALEALVSWTTWQKQQTIFRTDSGFGSDDNINYALNRDWQILTKGHGGRRPASFAKRISGESWSLVGTERWVAPVPQAPVYACPTQTLLLKWLNQRRQIKMATVVCSLLEWTPEQVIGHYDDRGQCETQIQSDKGGLKLTRRRKQSLAAQEGLILLTDLAHNLIAWSQQWMAFDKPIHSFGTTRFIDDVLAIPGELIFNQGRLVKVKLNERHPYAQNVALGLQSLLLRFDIS